MLAVVAVGRHWWRLFARPTSGSVPEFWFEFRLPAQVSRGGAGHRLLPILQFPAQLGMRHGPLSFLQSWHFPPLFPLFSKTIRSFQPNTSPRQQFRLGAGLMEHQHFQFFKTITFLPFKKRERQICNKHTGETTNYSSHYKTN